MDHHRLMMHNGDAPLYEGCAPSPLERSPNPFHFACYNGPRRGFLDLPLELRDVIYYEVLVARSSRPEDFGMPVPIPMTKGKPFGALYLIAEQEPKFDRSKPHCTRHRLTIALEKPAVQLLCVNKQIHFEAARVLYGSNEFIVPIGINCLNWFKFYDNFRDPIESFVDLPCHYLKMVRKCELRIRLPPLMMKDCKKAYLQAKSRLEKFADAMKGQDHSLKKLRIILFGWSDRRKDFVHKIPRLQNVLEPLGAVNGISDVTIEGVEPDFMAKLKNALTGNKIACSPIEEKYGTRKVKVRGRKRIQSYKLSRYYDPKYNWTMDRSAATDPDKDQKPEDARMTEPPKHDAKISNIAI